MRGSHNPIQLTLLLIYRSDNSREAKCMESNYKKYFHRKYFVLTKASKKRKLRYYLGHSAVT